MNMQEIFEAYKKLNPNWENETRTNNPALEAARKHAAADGDKNSCVFMSDYLSDELKAECAKHPDIYEYEAMYENSPEII